MNWARAVGALVGCLLAVPASADTAQVAVAANFTAVAEQLAELFTAQTGHELRLSFGATGLLYAQITQGAPFDVLLAADSERPARAVAEGLGVAGSVFTYATGTLVLYSTSLPLGDGVTVLSREFSKLAIADPIAAPYGRAAVEVLTKLELYRKLEARLVVGENIAQTLQFVETGNAELGFVALSQVAGGDNIWVVPAELYAPIRQDAVLLQSGAENVAATAFLAFLRSEDAVRVIEAAGYRVNE